MISTLVISILCAIGLFLSILFLPTFNIKKLKIDTYIIVCLVSAILLLILSPLTLSETWNELISNTAINPLKILCLFISMSLLSIFLDEVGFFKYLAYVALNKAKGSQIKIFIYLYLLTSVLTVFTSNDIIILTFTPFICYFCKRANINPLPYLIEEFIAANTWSMMLVIGNPTNIYIAESFNITFVEYIEVMAIPTIAGGLCSFIILYLLFRKSLSKKLGNSLDEVKIENKPLMIVGLVLLSLCIILLAISNYINVQMWIICLAFALIFISFGYIYSIFDHPSAKVINRSLKRAPWQLIPFVLSMFVIVLSLNKVGITNNLNSLLSGKYDIYSYGYSSMLFCNAINNIPMSLLFTKVIGASEVISKGIVYASIAGSNIGAFLTPIGALAGIMWMGILDKNGVKLSFAKFIKYGVIIAIPTITITLLTLSLMC